MRIFGAGDPNGRTYGTYMDEYTDVLTGDNWYKTASDPYTGWLRLVETETH